MPSGFFYNGQTLLADPLNQMVPQVDGLVTGIVNGGTLEPTDLVFDPGGSVFITDGTIYSAITAEQFAALDLSILPTSDPGGGMPWLNGGVMQVGP